MRRHSGTWVVKLSTEEILANGKLLREQFDQLSHQDFERYARKTFDIDYRRALDWMNIVRRFEENPGRIRGLSEAVIRRLAAPSLLMPDVEQILLEIRTGKIKSDYRSVEKAIRNLKEAKLQQEESVTTLPNAAHSSKISTSTHDVQPLVEQMKHRKQKLEDEKADFQLKLSDWEKKLSTLRTRKTDLEKEITDTEAREKQMQTEIDRRDVEIQTMESYLKLHEPNFT